MIEMPDGETGTLAQLTTALVAAYVSNNPVPASELPALIARVHGAIAGLVSGTVTAESGPVAQTEVEKPSPAQIRKSVRHDGIVSFIDGKTYKTLKRHLSSHGLDPRSYRDRYGLPADYPMVAPGYAEQRSALAKAIGLGQPGAMAERERKCRRTA
ncbi:Ros/MucR family transcriptional regulator [Methylobacterium sp. CM6257]